MSGDFSKVLQVGGSQVRVRASPSLGGAMVRWLSPGTVVNVDPASRQETDGYVWWRHSAGWSAERSADGSEVYLVEPPPASELAASDKVFQVGTSQVRVRANPSLSGAMVQWLDPGTQVAVVAGSRTEADGYVWWQHASGWSAERNDVGTIIFMFEVAATPEKTTDTVKDTAKTDAASSTDTTATTEAAPKPTHTGVETKPYKAGRVKVRVRAEPSLEGSFVKWLSPGDPVNVFADSRKEEHGYIWWCHADGWSAERSLDGTEIYLVDPDTPLDVAPTDGEPDLNVLPLKDGLFKRFPVALDQTDWFQYFGNNVFAYDIWREGKRWYAFSQGLHAGLDFGNSRTRGVKIVAGVEGTFMKRDTNFTLPNGMWVKVGDYTIIYGHTANPSSFNIGDPIHEDTVIGELQFGGQNHLHLEIRYKGKWIVNPLTLFPQTLRDQIVAKFPPGVRYFYQDAAWTQWVQPLDQPVLLLGGNLIGPHAR